MTYRNSKKKKRINKRLLKYYNEGINKGWLKEYKIPYLKRGYRDEIDPHTGKYIGWSEVGIKYRHLNKTHRKYSKKLIKKQLKEMELNDG